MWFERRARSLAGVTAPTKVRVRGEVLDGPTWTSPFSGVSALLFGWSFFVNAKQTMMDGIVVGGIFGTDEERATKPKLASVYEGAWAAEALRIRVEDGVVVVPIADPTVRFRHPAPAPEPTTCNWPAYLGPIPSRLGALYFSERTLIAGDRVELIATVEPAPGSAGGYRSASLDPFVVRTELEGVVLVET